MQAAGSSKRSVHIYMYNHIICIYIYNIYAAAGSSKRSERTYIYMYNHIISIYVYNIYAGRRQ